MAQMANTVLTPIPLFLRYVKSVQKINHLQKMFCKCVK